MIPFQKLATISVALLAISAPAYADSATDRTAALTAVAESYRPGVSGFGTVAAQDVDIDTKKHTVTIRFAKTAAYLPLTEADLTELKKDCLAALGPEYSRYKIKLFAGDRDMDSLALYSKKKNIGPKEKKPFVTRLDVPRAPSGLDGANIALWQSHGWYFEPKLNRWEWQRARLMQTVEDLYTQSYVMPFLMPMLENAGAYVMSPRERDIQRTEIIADNDGGKLAKGQFSTTGDWTDADKPGFAYTKELLHNGDHPFADGTVLKAALSGKNTPTATATWLARIPLSGKYAVYISYATLPNSTEAAEYIVHADDGDHRFIINQRMGGGTWIYLGHFPLRKSEESKTVVELLNSGKNRRQAVTADAVKIGGGMGIVARKIKEAPDGLEYDYVSSGYPKFTEGARYFLQWAGAPDSVFTPTDYVNDYGDDYRSRGLWVNWLAGGSSMLPKRKGLNIPVDLSFAFHTDAGLTPNDSIIGTLGIYCTNGGTTGNGSSRAASRDFTNDVMTNIVDGVRAEFDPTWTRRGMWDESYFEARVPEVPAMLLEFLSHQNFADMKYGLDPAFRFTVSRGIYKGMLKFIARRDGRPYVVQPLPVRSFAISHTGADSYRLSWKETVDSLESTATPTYYIVEERIGDGAFRPVSRTSDPYFDIAVSDSDIHSYRIVAGNDGGRAFPSEVLALCNMPSGRGEVTIVNGFTRVSAPDTFDYGEVAGFNDAKDHGVPYVYDISYIGSQYEFDRNSKWTDDDACGFGASRANYEQDVIAGNTFDFVYSHGRAVRDAGFGFVSSSVEAFAEAADTPAIVDIVLGKQKEIKRGRGAYGTNYKAFPAELQSRMTALAGQGTDFFVSGSYVASDLCANTFSTETQLEADRKFAADILGIGWRTGQASVTGRAYEVQPPYKAFGKSDYTFVHRLSRNMYAVESPDSFFPANKEKGCTFMRYKENNLAAGTAFDNGTHRTVVIGFPFETIMNPHKRAGLMKQILDFFTDANPLRNSKK